MSLLQNRLLVLLFAGLVAISACSHSDEDISKQVKAGVEILDTAIQVSVQEGVVTLSGEVEDESIKNAAESSIKEVKGVRSVVNNLAVKADLPNVDITVRPDSEIREFLMAGLAANNIQHITATVKAGEIILSGEARKTDLPIIMRIANEARAKNIRNELKVK